jgi:hypothetical protein
MADELHRQLEDARGILRVLPKRYADAHSQLHAIPGQRLGRGRSGKPTSAMPPGLSFDLHGDLVSCARALSDAHGHAGSYGGPLKPWNGEALQLTEDARAIRLGEKVLSPVILMGCPLCGAQAVEGSEVEHGELPTGIQGERPPCSGEVQPEVADVLMRERWKPEPSDLSLWLPLPDIILGASDHLAGQLGRVQSMLDEVEHGPAWRATAAVNRARGALERAGVWRKPRRDPRDSYHLDMPRCRRPWCQIGAHADGLCRGHYDEERRAS